MPIYYVLEKQGGINPLYMFGAVSRRRCIGHRKSESAEEKEVQLRLFVIFVSNKSAACQQQRRMFVFGKVTFYMLGMPFP